MEAEIVMGSQGSKLKKGAGDWYAKCQNCLFLSLPTNEAHSNHPTGPDIAFAQKVYPLLIAKISDLVSSNICDVHEVKKMIKHYSDNESLALSHMSIIVHFIQT